MTDTHDALLVFFGLLIGGAVGYGAPILWHALHEDEVVTGPVDPEYDEEET